MLSKNLFYRNPHLISYLFCFGLILFAFGIPWSVYLVSNSVIILSLLILFKFDLQKSHWTFNRTITQDIQGVIETPLLLFMMLAFFSVLISGLWSEETRYWIWFSRMKLPFLLLPVVFFIHGQLSMKQWKLILYVFIATTFCFSSYILVEYLKNYQELNLQLLKGKPIVTHISHIRFSMIVAIAGILSLHYAMVNRHVYSQIERWIFVPLVIFFFFFNHLLSVKTGIIGMDLGLLAYISIELFRRKKYKTWLIAISSILLLICLAFICLPSLQNKFYYTIWQFGEWQRGKWLYYSDIERWVSIQMGIEMIKHHPGLGCGMGDLYQMTKETYLECLNHNEPKLPHNQFIYTWAFTGLPGIAALVGMIYYSAFQKRWLQDPLISAIQVVLLISLLFEYTFETQIGASLYVYFTLLCWVYLRAEMKSW